MYVDPNFKTKKELKEQLKINKEIEAERAAITNDTFDPVSFPFNPERRFRSILVYQPNDMFGTKIPDNGTVYLEGPHYPKPHTWYAEGTMKNGKLISVK